MRCVFVLLLVLASPALSLDYMLADITEPVTSSFATYTPIPVDVEPSVEPSVEPWTIEPDLSNVINAGEFTLTDREKELLIANSFVVLPVAGHAEVYDIYNENRDLGIPSFVTGDALLHAYHLLFDHLLKRAELTTFFVNLHNLNTTLVSAAVTTLAEASSPDEVSAAKKLLGFHSVAASLLDSAFQPDPEIRDVVDQELELIRAQQGVTYSPLFGSPYEEDYTQYKVRGHYVLNDTLSCYFQTMMWYGRLTFVLDERFPDQDLVRDLTLSALLLARDVARNLNTEIQWATIYWPTVFFVGRSDDIFPEIYKELAEIVYGSSMSALSVEELADSTLLESFIEEARQTFQPPEIGNVGWQGLRMMGQRFIPDSYVFEQLVWPHCLRTMPRGLDIMASLGSDRAMWLLDNVYDEFSDPAYVAQLQVMREYMESVSDSTWAGNLYYNWLYSLMPLLFEKDDGWPVFMMSPAWSDRELSTSLMSWSELRHDTILYAKQSYTSGVPPAGAMLNGYVEPNPYLWARLAALADYTASGLDGLGLLGPKERQRLDMLHSLCLNLLDISIAELEETPLSPAQDSLIAAIGIELLMISAVDEDLEIPDSPGFDDDCTAVIADVHTDLVTQQCLEEGVGYPWTMLTVVRRGGRLILTRGVHIPYYEFTVPHNQRMTDEEWQELLTGSNPPTPPVWTEVFRDSSVSLLNPSTDHFWYETKYVCSFSFSLSPEVLDTGQVVTVDVSWAPYWSGGVPAPYLTVVSPSGDSCGVSLDLIGGSRYQGTLSTTGWVQADAMFHFTSTDPYDNVLMDWATLIPVGTASGPGPSPNPGNLTLRGIRPNPVGETGTISFTLPDPGPTRLSIWDLAGRERAVLYDGHLPAGHHVMPWSTKNTRIPEGAYLLRLSWEDETRSQIVVMEK